MKDSTIIQGVSLKEVLRDELKSSFAGRYLKISELVEFYLVNLMDSFHNNELSDEPLAALILSPAISGQANRIQYLKRLGDTSLLLNGLLIDKVRNNIVSSSYYSSIGRLAYSRLSSLYSSDELFADLYKDLSVKFEDIAEAMSAVAPWNKVSSNSSIVQIYERWVSSGDENLKSILEDEGLLS